MPGHLAAVDWGIVLLYVAFALWVGVRFAKRAGVSVDEYFLSGRSLPWWVAGTSMVATSFAADTPLLITGWVRDEGIWKNWVWWCLMVNVALQIFLFSRWWRRAGVMTKAQLVELRYGGSGARALRGILGFLHAGILNTMTICWVLVAAGKISKVLFDVDQTVGLTVACAIALVYSLLAGFWGVVVTDLVQFAFAMIGGIAFAWIAWSAVGGAEAIQAAVAQGVIPAERLTVVPAGNGETFWTEPMAAFAVYLGVAWWAFESVDGSGVGVQRISACRDERHGLLALLWYSVAHYALRPWCWVLVGLASLLVLPSLEVTAPAAAEVVEVTGDAIVLDADGVEHRLSLDVPGSAPDWRPEKLVEVGDRVAAGARVAATDSELAYVRMMVRYLPVGLLGLVAASLLAAFMSTIDTHVNLASSFFVNDLYRRFLAPDEAPRHYVAVARIATVFVLSLGGLLASQTASVRSLFEFFLAFLAGVGPIYVARWLWWRVRASTEITAMVTSAVVSTVATYHAELGFEWSLGALSVDGELTNPGRVVVVAAVSIVAALASMLVTRTPDPRGLVGFYRRTRPFGWWGPVKALVSEAERAPRDEPLPALGGVFGALALVYGAMLGLGALFLDQAGALRIALAATAAGTLVVAWAVRRLTRAPTGSAQPGEDP